MIRALAAEAERGGPSGSLFVDALGTALASQIVDAFGVEMPAAMTTGISPATLHEVYAFIDGNLGENLTVDAIAATARLSPAHFARVFKDATGISPHRFVMKRRLEAARGWRVPSPRIHRTPHGLHCRVLDSVSSIIPACASE